MTSVQDFLNTFLKPPKGDSPKDIAQRIRHWIDVANNPEQYVQDQHPLVVATRRKSARQNLRKLIERHPHIAEQIMHETQLEAQQ